MKALILSLFFIVCTGCTTIISPNATGAVVNENGAPLQANIHLQHVQLKSHAKNGETFKDGMFFVKGLSTKLPWAIFLKQEAIVTISAPGYQSNTYNMAGIKDRPRNIVLEKSNVNNN